jgi:serine/threonine-protein kinase
VADDVFGIVGSTQADVFRVSAVVAEGGFAVVYRARHEGFRADVALKCLKVPGAMTTAQQHDFLEKFREEGELLFRLSALIPTVVRPLQLGALSVKDGRFVPFIALEWLDGESLDSIINKRRAAGKAPLDLARVARLLGPVARALECAHAFPGPDGRISILHRDLKPENLFVAHVHGQETPKVLDFGIGKVKSVATQMVGRVSADQSGLSAFTPAYGAPEQWLPKRYGQTGPWTDVFGFALCIVEALTGKAPFDGDAPATMGACIDETNRPTPRTLGVSVPDGVERALARALAVDPRERTHDIGQLWDEIERAAGVVTARIGAKSASLLESIPPPPELALPELELELDAPAAAPAKVPSSAKVLAKPPAEDDFKITGLSSQIGASGATAARAAQSSGVELDAGSFAPPSAARARGQRVAAAVSVRRDGAASTAKVVRSFSPALTLIGVGVAVMAVGLIAQFLNVDLALGPVRPFWIAAPLVVLGLARLIRVLGAST